MYFHYTGVYSFIFHVFALWIELPFYFIVNWTWINAHAIFPLVFLPPSIFTLLWLSFDDLEIYVVPFRLRYLQVVSQFSARKCLKSYFLGKRNDLSQNDLSECNKMLKELKSRLSRMTIFLVFPWKIVSYFLFVQIYFFASEILCDFITDAINM